QINFILHQHLLYKMLMEKPKFELKNLNKVQKAALEGLKNDRTIIMQKADKGGAIVIQNTDKYISKIKTMLSDSSCYKKLIFNPTIKYKSQIDRMLNRGVEEKWITEQKSKWLTHHHPVVPVLYALPKIHKSIVDPPYRPIVSGIGSLTEKLSIFIDYYLQPLVKQLPSYLRDTTDCFN
uniref:Uncharacterized protein n=1 Tax=Sinocyclocheilus rhinocerous TaxID=307959 RepID=A0A673N3A4_9TELE